MPRANKFTLKGHHIEIDYTIGGNPGFTALTYKDESTSHDFKPTEITTDPTALGSLVSVPLARSIDTGGTTFAFFLPDIDVAPEKTTTFTTAAVREDFSGPNSVPHRPTTWHTFVLHGTAKSVIVAL